MYILYVKKNLKESRQGSMCFICLRKTSRLQNRSRCSYKQTCIASEKIIILCTIIKCELCLNINELLKYFVNLKKYILNEKLGVDS